MLKIRLKRIGKKKQPHYRFVIAEATKSRDSKTIEEIGYYNTMTNPSTIKLDQDRAKYWLGKGAQPTDTVAQIFVKEKLLKSLKKGSTQSKGKNKKKGQEEKSE
jgi:small subunit ribosomal protein S16